MSSMAEMQVFVKMGDGDSGSGCAAIPYSGSGEVHGITEEDVIVLQRRGCCVSFHGREASER